MLQHDAFGFDGASKHTQQTVVNNGALVTEKMWSQINQIIVKHDHEVLGISADAPLDVRCDSYVSESYIETPHDVRILRNSVWNSLKTASHACEALGLDAYDDITGWRQYLHLSDTVHNDYLTINTSKKRAKHPEWIKAFFDLCYTRIKKCHGVLNTIKDIDPASKWVSRLETAIAQFERQTNLVRCRLIDGETIPNAEKLLSLHAEYIRWCRKGKSYPDDVEWGVPVCILEDEHRLMLGWEIMWTESDVEMTVPIVTKYTDLYPIMASISFDRGFGFPGNFDALSGLDVQVILPKKGNKNKEKRSGSQPQSFKRNVGDMSALSRASTA